LHSRRQTSRRRTSANSGAGRFLGALLVLLAAAAIAPASAQVTPPQATLKLTGEVDWDLYYYFRDSDPSGAVRGRNQIRFEPRLKAKVGVVGAAVQLQLRHDFLDPDRSRILFKDAYAQVRWGGFQVRAGNQVIRWSRMDMRPSLDVLTPKDYDELWAPERLAAPALMLKYAHPNIALSAVWLPTFVPARYSVSYDHRWNVLLSQPHVGVADDVSFPIHYLDYEDPQVLVGGERKEPKFLDSQYGMRLEFFFPRIDLAVTGYYGRDQLPTYHHFVGLNGDVIDPSAQDLITFIEEGIEVELTPIHAHKGVIGGDMALVLGPVVVKGELSYHVTADAKHDRCDIHDPYLMGTVGVEWLATDLVGKQDLQVRFEVAGDHELPPSDDDVINRDAHCEVPKTETPIRDVNHLSVLGFYGNIQWYFSDDVMLDLRGFGGIEGDYLARAELALTVRDRVRLGLAGLITGGYKGSFMNSYTRNDRIEFSTTYMF